MAFDAINIYDLIAADEKLFEQAIRTFTSINDDIEDFLKNSAIGFAKRKQAVTYLVFKDKVLVGYFTVAVKTFEIKESYISKTVGKKLERVVNLMKIIIATGLQQF